MARIHACAGRIAVMAAAVCLGTAAARVPPPVAPVGYAVDGVVSKDAGMLDIFIPIPNASLCLQAVVEVVPLPLAVPEGSAPAPAALLFDSTRSDSTGAFSFDNVPAGGYLLTVGAKGYRTRTLDLGIAADRRLTIPLVAEGSFAVVQGVVRARQCSALPAADVLPCVPRAVPACTVWAAIAEDLPPYVKTTEFVPVPAEPVAALVAVTGADGAYVIDSIPLAYSGQRLIVWTRLDGFDPVTVDTVAANGVATIVDFALQPSVGTEISLDTPQRRTHAAGPVGYAERERVLSVHIDRGQIVSIEAFVLSGRRDGRLSARRFFEAGTYRFSLNSPRLGTGVMIVRVRGEDFADTRRIVLTEGK